MLRRMAWADLDAETVALFLPLRARARAREPLVLQARLQFEAANPIIAQPPEDGIATGHFRIKANVAK